MNRKKILAFLAILGLFLYLFSPSPASAATYAGYEGLTVNDGTKLSGLINAPFPIGVILQSYNGHLYYTPPSPGDVTGTRGLPIDIVLSYNLGAVYQGEDTPYGYGWQLSYGIGYAIEPNGDVMITWGDGREDLFTKSGTSFIPPPGIHVTLEEYVPGKYRITMKHGVRMYFDDPVPKKITSMTEPNGNTLTFTYNGSNLLTTVTDPSGKAVSLTYGLDGRLDSITDPAGNTWVYNHNSGGDLLSVTDPLGNSSTLAYDTAHRLNTVTDAEGNSTIISYANFSGFGTVVRRIENGGTVWSFSYNYSTKTATVTDTKGYQWQYTYDSYSNGRISQVRDPFGNTRKYTWDSGYNRVSYIDQNGTRTDMTYDPEGNLTSRTEAVGTALQRKTDYTYTSDGFNNIASVKEAVGTADERLITYGYNAQGNLTSQCVDPAGLNLCTTYIYGSYGNHTSMTNPKGVVTTYEYNEPGPNSTTTGNLTKAILDPSGLALTTSYEYDALGNRVKVTDPNGKVTCNQYDTLNDALNESFYNLVKIIRKVGDTNCAVEDANDVVTQFTYDRRGNRLTGTDPNGNSSSYAYDNLDRIITATDALGNTSQTAYDSVGNRIKQVDPNNEVTCTKYDALHRSTQVIRIMAGNANVRDTIPGPIDCETYTPDMNDASTQYTYDAVGNQLSGTDPNGNTATYTYDALYRRIAETNPLSEATTYTYDWRSNQKTVIYPGSNITTYAYDKADRVTSISDTIAAVASYTYDANGNRLTSTDGNGNGNSIPNTYDNADRLIIARDNLDVATQYTYDANGNQLSATDRNGNVTCSTYDDLNRRVQTIQNIVDTSCAIDGNDIVTTYVYDENSNQTDIVDANGNTTSYSYDALNRLITETYDDLTTRSFTYDDVGNMLTRLDQNGTTTSYTYDDLYRLKIRDYPGTNDDYFTYDAGGRMLTASNNDASISYSYDAANRTTSETLNGKTTGYSFDIPNREKTITYPGGKVIVEARDLRQRLDTIEEGLSTIADYDYDLGDRTTVRNLLNGVNATYSYNANNWVTDLQHTLGLATVADFQYDFDSEGNRIYQEKLHDASNSEAYSYDDVYRVTDFEQGTLSGGTIPAPSTQTQYNYDLLGNRTTTVTDAVLASYAVNNMNEYTSINGFAQTSDNNGNLLVDGMNTYAYDTENRLTSVNSGLTATYKYDPMGRRIQKVAGMTAVNYYFDGSRVIEERDAIDAVVATYVYGSWIDEALQMVRGGNTYYYHQTSLGNIEVITDASGGIAEAYRHDAYGIEEDKPADASHPPTQKELSVLTGPGLDTTWFTGDDVIAAVSAIDNPYAYTGREYDPETRLYYYRARYYNGTTGRFMQRDPLGYVDGMNLFEYVRGNPVNFTDPYGEQETPVCNERKKGRKDCSPGWDITFANDAERDDCIAYCNSLECLPGKKGLCCTAYAYNTSSAKVVYRCACNVTLVGEKPTEPVKPEPVKPEPVKPEPVKPEPVKPEPPPTAESKPCKVTCNNKDETRSSADPLIKEKCGDFCMQSCRIFGGPKSCSWGDEAIPLIGSPLPQPR